MKGVPQGLIVETEALTAATLLRREPYRLFFPLGILMAWAGVLHWLLHGLGLLADYRPVFHATVQIQGFLMCFAVGFLFTMIPRRTGSAPPKLWEMGIAALAPVTTTIAAWNGYFVFAQLPWLLLTGTLIAFAVRRFISATSRRRPPNAFVWIPMALLMGIAGSLMMVLSELTHGASTWVGLGRALLQQGMFTGLVLGVGSLALPLMIRGEAPADAAATLRDRLVRLAHVLGGVLMAVSFWIGVAVSLRTGMLLRGGIVLAVLLLGPQIWRRPRPIAWNARVILLAAWMVPLGYLLAAAFPLHYRGGLHVTLIAGFALLTLAISSQVVLGHGGHQDLMFGRPWQVVAVTLLALLATAARSLMEIDSERYFSWMVTAAASFLLATLVWGFFLIPKLQWRRTTSSES